MSDHTDTCNHCNAHINEAVREAWAALDWPDEFDFACPHCGGVLVVETEETTILFFDKKGGV